MRTAYALVRHEARLLASLALWIARRTHGTAGGRGFGYTRGQGAVMAGFAFVCVIETLTMSVLLRDWPSVHRVVLVLDVYTVVLIVALHAASVVRPHVLEADAVRVRNGVRLDLRIPLERIATVRRETRSTHDGADTAALNIAVGAQTTVTLDLTGPVTHVGLLGRRREVTTVRLHADEADHLVGALKGALTRARTAPVPLPDPPG
ncbi:hypothetical protein [Streptomyces olivochromogenes]|uniref:hypothetical protein n=1 Tax=Streptomyces olivochromogenes TaxID=1963 RepID=UPI001F2B8CE3|nr:hypothetical protein [Streptomyces olivochromogenes]MCF3134200.1 hypothetical protein [Streptomyces olivochromogenes]